MWIIEEFHERVIPVVVFFVVLSVFGFFGNLLIIYIYSFRYEKNHFRRLVLSLSFVDMISCCTTVPMETVSTWLWFSAPSRGLCKLKNFCTQFSALSAIYMLFVIAVYKYLRICRSRQLTNKTIVILFIVGICVSLFMATPAAILWDINEDDVVVNNANKTLRICEVFEDYIQTVYPKVYRNVLSAYDLFLLATIVLYIFVAKTIIKHIREKRKKEKTYQPEKDYVTSTSKDSDKIGQDEPEANKDSEGVSRDSVIANRQLKRSPPCQLSSAQIRKAVIMVILAGTFSVTFLMGLSFGYVFAFRDFKDFPSIGEMVWLFACYRLYFANYALNFIVYFILDRAFRSEVFKLFGITKSACVNP